MNATTAAERPIIDTTAFARHYRTRSGAGEGGDQTWMPDNVTVAVLAQSTNRVLLLHEKKPGMVLRFGESYAPPRPHSLEVDLGAAIITLAENEVLTMPSGSIKNNWEGKPENVEPLQYLETWEEAVRRQLKGETGRYVDGDIIDLKGSFVKPANMPTYDMYAAILLSDEYVPTAEGIDPTIKGGYWCPFEQALELVDAGLINHDPAAQTLLRLERYLRKNR